MLQRDLYLDTPVEESNPQNATSVEIITGVLSKVVCLPSSSKRGQPKSNLTSEEFAITTSCKL